MKIHLGPTETCGGGGWIFAGPSNSTICARLHPIGCGTDWWCGIDRDAACPRHQSSLFGQTTWGNPGYSTNKLFDGKWTLQMNWDTRKWWLSSDNHKSRDPFPVGSPYFPRIYSRSWSALHGSSSCPFPKLFYWFRQKCENCEPTGFIRQ